MSHVVTVQPEPIELASGRERLHIVLAARDNLVWVIEHADHTASVVDGPDANGLVSLLETRGLTLTTVLTTHTHGDHIGLHHDLARRGRLRDVRVIGSTAGDVAVPHLTDPVGDGDRVDVGSLTFDVIATEGHLRGHVCYTAPGLLFSGDTLFTGGCGYVFDGPMDALAASLLRLAALPSDRLVCCAHDYTLDNLMFARLVEPGNERLRARYEHVAALRAAGRCAVPSRLDEEQATNPFLRPGSSELLARLAAMAPNEPLHDALAVIGVLRRLKNTGRYRDATVD